MTNRQSSTESASGSTEPDRAELEELRARLREAEDALEVIRSGEVDAVVVGGPLGQQIYSITNADRPYRLLDRTDERRRGHPLEHGLIAYCNDSLCLAARQTRRHRVSGSQIQQFILQTDISLFENLLSSANGGRIVLTLVGGRTGGDAGQACRYLLFRTVTARRIVCGIVTDLRQLRQSTQGSGRRRCTACRPDRRAASAPRRFCIRRRKWKSSDN